MAESADARGTLLSKVDHLVYAVPDLELAVDEVEKRLGVRASQGGRHPGRGTRNALLALGARSYLEIIGPDPEQRAVSVPLWFAIDRITAPALISWAANTHELEGVVAHAAQRGIELGNVLAGSRTRTDGVELRWRYTDPRHLVADGIMPFFIDWGDTPHPAETAAPGASLIALRAEHPEPARVQGMLRAFGLDVPVHRAQRPALIATIDCARGRVELR